MIEIKPYALLFLHISFLCISPASRILRPGGWIILSDIMQEEILADPESMKAIYKRINLSEMGTVSNYKKLFLEDGGGDGAGGDGGGSFTNFSKQIFSNNIPEHYGRVLQVLQDVGPSLGISQEYQTSAEVGLQVWKDSSKGNIVWGFLSAQKK